MTCSEVFRKGYEAHERYFVTCGKWVDKEPYAEPKDYDICILKKLDKKVLKDLVANPEYRNIQLYDKVGHTTEILKNGKLKHEDYI